MEKLIISAFIASLSMPALTQSANTPENDDKAAKIISSLTELPKSVKSLFSNADISQEEEKEDITLMVEKLLKTLDEFNNHKTSSARAEESMKKKLKPVKDCDCPF